jgi:polyribonucleotide nucleotidyltransferase
VHSYCVLVLPVHLSSSGSFLKREGRPRDDDVLVARLVDRPIRPMFEKGWCNETQVRRSLQLMVST